MKKDRDRRELQGWTRVAGFSLLFPSWSALHAGKAQAELVVAVSQASLPFAQ